MPPRKPMPRTFDTAWTFTEARLAAPRIGPYGFPSAYVPEEEWTDDDRLLFARCVHLIAPLTPSTRPCKRNVRVYCEHNVRAYLPHGPVQLACVALGVSVRRHLDTHHAQIGLASEQRGLGPDWMLDSSRADEPEADPSFWLGHRLTR